MRYKLKMKLRALSTKNVLLSKLYHKASQKKVEFFQNLSDEEFLKLKFKENTGKELNLENPQTFNEKLQWLKLYDRNPIYTTMADKFRAKEYIAERVGKEYIVPMFGVWNSPDDVDFSALPEQFVIKCNHDCGGLSICRSKDQFDANAARNKLKKSFLSNYFEVGREWQYKNIEPVVLAEKLLENSDGSPLVEYDFFCFNGEPRIISCAWGDRDKGEEHYNDFYDADFNRLPLSCIFPTSSKVLEKPSAFEEMKNIARKLCGNRSFLRVDIYLCDDKPYVGELTFHHWGGMGIFNPKEWDEKLGSWLALPTKK